MPPTQIPSPAPKDKSISLGDFTCFEGFSNPIEFLAFFDIDINEGRTILYKWQVEVGESFGKVKPTHLEPHKFCLCAANGSGKDMYVIAPFVLWFVCCKIQSLVIITSASAAQLNTQTERHIANLAKKVNAYTLKNFGTEVLNVRQRRVTCSKSGSEVFLFATDEDAKAEGYHPSTGKEMAIIVNEAKSVKHDIFDALRRCTGFNYWLNVSTPGEPKGDFYSSWRNWEHKRKVTYYDCMAHQSAKEFEEEKKTVGEHNYMFRSKWLAEFSYVGGKTVIDQERLGQLRDEIAAGGIKWVKGETYVGIDLSISTHGDETVVTCFNGNKQLQMLVYRIKDAMILAENLDKDLRTKIGIPRDHRYVAADDGGIGHPVLDILKRIGWSNIRRVLNNHKPHNSRDFRNRGAEMYYKLIPLVDRKAIILLDDNKLYEQLESRKYRESDQGLDKLQLEEKKHVKGRGDPSPDRADATVLAISMMDTKELLDKVELIEDKPEIDNSLENRIRLARAELRKIQQGDQRSGNPISSLNAYMHKNRKQLTYRDYEKRN